MVSEASRRRFERQEREQAVMEDASVALESSEEIHEILLRATAKEEVYLQFGVVAEKADRLRSVLEPGAEDKHVRHLTRRLSKATEKLEEALSKPPDEVKAEEVEELRQKQAEAKQKLAEAEASFAAKLGEREQEHQAAIEELAQKADYLTETERSLAAVARAADAVEWLKKSPKQTKLPEYRKVV